MSYTPEDIQRVLAALEAAQTATQQAAQRAAETEEAARAQEQGQAVMQIPSEIVTPTDRYAQEDIERVIAEIEKAKAATSAAAAKAAETARLAEIYAPATPLQRERMAEETEFFKPYEGQLGRYEQEAREQFQTGLTKSMEQSTKDFQKQLEDAKKQARQEFGQNIPSYQQTQREQFEISIGGWEAEIRAGIEVDVQQARTSFESSLQAEKNKALQQGIPYAQVAQWEAAERAKFEASLQEYLKSIEPKILQAESKARKTFEEELREQIYDVQRSFEAQLKTWATGELSSFEKDIAAWAAEQKKTFSVELGQWKFEQTHELEMAKLQWIQEWKPKGIGERIADLGKIIQTPTGYVSKALGVDEIKATPLQDPFGFLGGVVAGVESFVYSLGTLLGVPTPRIPATVTGGLITSGIESFKAGELKTSPEMKAIMDTEGWYAAGTIVGDILVSLGISKGFEYAGKGFKATQTAWREWMIREHLEAYKAIQPITTAISPHTWKDILWMKTDIPKLLTQAKWAVKYHKPVSSVFKAAEEVSIALAKKTVKGKIEQSLYWGMSEAGINLFDPAAFEFWASIAEASKFAGYPVIRKATEYGLIQLPKEFASEQELLWHLSHAVEDATGLPRGRMVTYKPTQTLEGFKLEPIDKWFSADIKGMSYLQYAKAFKPMKPLWTPEALETATKTGTQALLVSKPAEYVLGAAPSVAAATGVQQVSKAGQTLAAALGITIPQVMKPQAPQGFKQIQKPPSFLLEGIKFNVQEMLFQPQEEEVKVAPLLKLGSIGVQEPILKGLTSLITMPVIDVKPILGEIVSPKAEAKTIPIAIALQIPLIKPILQEPKIQQKSPLPYWLQISMPAPFPRPRKGRKEEIAPSLLKEILPKYKKKKQKYLYPVMGESDVAKHILGKNRKKHKRT